MFDISISAPGSLSLPQTDTTALIPTLLQLSYQRLFFSKQAQWHDHRRGRRISLYTAGVRDDEADARCSAQSRIPGYTSGPANRVGYCSKNNNKKQSIANSNVRPLRRPLLAGTQHCAPALSLIPPTLLPIQHSFSKNVQGRGSSEFFSIKETSHTDERINYKYTCVCMCVCPRRSCFEQPGWEKITRERRPYQTTPAERTTSIIHFGSPQIIYPTKKHY